METLHYRTPDNEYSPIRLLLVDHPQETHQLVSEYYPSLV